jgi:selenium metabolism protein YedF
VTVDNEASCSNVTRFAESQSCLVSAMQTGTDYVLRIVRGAAAPSADAPIVCETETKRSIAIYITADTMGRGDDDLGRILMGAYFETLTHFVREISHIILVNSGVKLAVDGSPVLDEVESLARTGIEVLVCGTCLNHFGIKDKLRAGVVSNMFTILDTLAKARKVLSP